MHFCVYTHTHIHILKQVLFSAALHSFFSNTFWPMRLSSAFLWWLCLWKENNLQKPGAPCLCQSWNSDISAEVQVCGCYACLTISRKQTTGQIGKHERVLLCTVLQGNVKLAEGVPAEEFDEKLFFSLLQSWQKESTSSVSSKIKDVIKNTWSLAEVSKLQSHMN